MIKIEQTLHGYASGHKLLNTSIELSENDKKNMVILSDLSGGKFVEKFDKYYTGYNLGEQLIVLACTWYATEMERPGCVWTHSLIFNKREIGKIGDEFGEILKLFHIPSNINQYGKTIYIESKNRVELHEKKLEYLIWCIGGNKLPIVIYDESAKNFENEIIYLFFNLNPVFLNSMTFCTGAISLRKYENKYLDMQIMPSNTSQNRNEIEAYAREAERDECISKYPLWVKKAYEELSIDNMKGFKKFLNRFPENYRKLEYLSLMIKLYVGADVQKFDTNLGKLLEMSYIISKRNIEFCNTIINMYCEGRFSSWTREENYIKSLNFFLDNSWMSLSEVFVGDLVKHAYGRQYIDSKQLFQKVIRMEANRLNEIIIKKFAEIVTVELFEEFTDFDYESCTTLIYIKNELALNDKIWNQSIGFQQAMIRCLNPENQYSQTIIKKILDLSKFDLTRELYGVYTEMCISHFFEYYLSETYSENMSNIKSYLCDNNAISVNIIIQGSYDKFNVLRLINITDSYSDSLKKCTDQNIKNLFDSISIESCSYEEKINIALFFLPLCITLVDKVADYISRFAYNISMELLANEKFPFDQWKKLEKILPEVSAYKAWDRCKRLRKAFRIKGYSFVPRKKEGLPDFLL